MAVSLRKGTYGDYYGNDFNSSNPLNQSQMEVNATYIYSYLHAEGWTINSIAALLGNLQAESSINPGRWQSDRVGGDTSGHGYGLVQWTPYTKYTEWITGDPSTMDNNLYRITWEVANNQQWIPVGEFKNLSFSDFTQSEVSPSLLAAAFLLCYERPADQSQAVQEYRGSLANAWYTYLTGVEPGGPTTSDRKKRKFNWILFNPRRRLTR